MADAKDIILGVVGFAISVYSGAVQDLLGVVIGIVIIILTIWLNLQDHEENIKILNAQINTQYELQRIKEQLKEMQNAKKK
ncbi:hypothetical protein HYY69_03225 [Candidatus Woesearchaeota archaeon]|nr:hypothetical protein [Candidatus Woesearchaeota archaeon]